MSIRQCFATHWHVAGTVVTLFVFAAAVVGASSFAYPLLLLSRVDLLLQSEYTERRPFPLRLPNRGYSRYNPITADANSIRPKLDHAIELLAGVSSRLAQSGRFQCLSARAALLGNRPDTAVSHYVRCVELDPAGRTPRLELAGALLIRSQAENRPLDLALALEQVGTATALKPVSALESCNLAELYSAIPAPHLARDEWTRCASLEPDLQWRAEAEQQRLYFDELIRERLRRMALVASPAGFLRESKRKPFPIEVALEAAVANWLPLRYSDPDAAVALRVTAEFQARDFRDPWLSDLLRSENLNAFSLLAAAARSNNTGSYEDSISAALQAEREFRAVSNRAGEMRARLERIYALQRSEHGRECTGYAVGLIEDLASTDYRWLKARAALELTTCKAKTQDSGSLITEREQIFSDIGRTGYSSLELRALGFMVQPELVRANPLRLHQLVRDGLTTYWQGEFQASRAQQFYIASAIASGDVSHFAFAAVMAREGVRVMEEIPNIQWRALCLSIQGALESRLEWHQAASSTFSSAHKLFEECPSTSTVRRWRVEAALYHLRAAAEVDSPDSVATLLESLRSSIADASVAGHQLAFDQTVGLVSLKAGRFQQARQAFEAARRREESELASIVDQGQRDAWVQESQLAYRGLAEISLLQHNNANETVRLLLQHRRSRLKGRSEQRNASIAPGTGVLIVARLATGTAVIAQNGASTEWRWLTRAKARTLESLARDFTRICGSEGGDATALRKAGSRLYSTLIAPFENLFQSAFTLNIVSEGDFEAMPWSALPISDNRFLIERAAIVQSDRFEPLPSAPLGSPLVVYEPAIDSAYLAGIPPLSEAREEAVYIGSLFQGARVIHGRQATASALKETLEHFAFFHFGGHGLSNGGFGALLLAPAAGETGAALLSANVIKRMHLQKLRLAVLAACSSGSGVGFGPVNPDSLVNAFLDAGTESVIAALWDVSSQSTSAMMKPFYSSLHNAQPPATALRTAAQVVLSNPATRHPYYWAAFQIYE